MWLLVRTLPLLIGHYIPVGDECFCLLLEILDICTDHVCTLNAVGYLKTLIEEHHSLFQSAYPHASIIPKMHFLIHYPEQIVKFGPLILSWTLRYEAKLKLCKQVAKFGNFKNICLSIARTMAVLSIARCFLHNSYRLSPRSLWDYETPRARGCSAPERSEGATKGLRVS